MESNVLRLTYQPPFDWEAMLMFFRIRGVEGIEQIEGEVYRRTIRHGEEFGTVEVTNGAAQHTLVAKFNLPSGQIPKDASVRLRRMFDLAADVKTIGEYLSRDATLAPLAALRPAMRVPGGWDNFEVAIRTVNGQQVSLAAAARLNARLVERCGDVFDGSRIFPTPQQVIEADLSAMGMPGARVATLRAMAEAVIANPNLFQPSENVEATVAKLREIKGIGEWSAQYIALRACREADAFPASDVGLLRGAVNENGRRPTPLELLARAETWRPWRGYAAQHIWAADAA